MHLITHERLAQRAALFQVARGFPDGSIKKESHQPVLSRHRTATEVASFSRLSKPFIRVEVPTLFGCVSRVPPRD
jgi:hypothetical protein